MENEYLEEVGYRCQVVVEQQQAEMSWEQLRASLLGLVAFSTMLKQVVFLICKAAYLKSH
jgi:hypothetical protein